MSKFTESEHIKLRAVEPRDVAVMLEVENDESAWYAAETQAPFSAHVMRQYADAYRADPFGEGQLRLIAMLKDSGFAVGIADFYELSDRHQHGFAGIYILPEFRRQGLGRELLELMKLYAFQALMLSQLAARIPSSNAPALSLFESSGFQRSGLLRGWHRAAGQTHDILLLQHPASPASL